MEELPRKENKMGVLPVGRLILTMSAPMVLSMLFQALYNVVDSVFVARLGQDAMNAVSLAFPLQTVLIGVSVGTGVGMNALVSRREEFRPGGRGGEYRDLPVSVLRRAVRPDRNVHSRSLLPSSHG